MNWDLFSYSNTGEPKQIVTEFVEEVVTSLHFLTSEACKVSLDGKPQISEEEMELMSLSRSDRHVYEEILQRKVRDERHKLWQSLVSATINIFVDKRNANDCHESMESLGQQQISTLPNFGSGVSKSQRSMSVFHRMEVLLFLKRARTSYGRTALCLSGGAMMGT